MWNKPVFDRGTVLVALALFAGLAWSLIVNGAVPYAGMPTMGQAASMMGYAQAFADQHWYSMHARSFGFPVPTSLATGLPLAWIAAWFIRSGMATYDAYAAAAAFWLLASYVGAFRLARILGAHALMAALAATCWMTLPIVWAHASYSSLALGIAMLPLYLSSAMALTNTTTPTPTPSARARLYAMLEFVGLCVISLFMDGYTFMMFVVASGIVLVYRIASDRSNWLVTMRSALPGYLVGFPGAYFLYTGYMGRSAFAPAPLEFFRGWGLDLTFLVKPTHGQFLLWDWLGWSSVRNDDVFFGDASVWNTTFGLPLLMAGLACFLCIRKRDSRAWLFLIVAMAGLYMSLGPSLKIDAVKPVGTTGPFMDAGIGLMSTGSALLSSAVPGFRAMRAAYRWDALFLLGMWCLVTLAAARAVTTRRKAWVGLYAVLMLSTTPHVMDAWGDYKGYRTGLASIDREIATPLSQRIRAGSRIFFVPFSNDVMANYLSPRLGVTTYNVGGDKQIEIARERWPADLQKLSMNHFDSSDVPTIRAALLAREADVVIIPYFDTLWAAHLWPCVAEASGFSDWTLALFAANKGFLCPAQLKAAYAQPVAALAGDRQLSVDQQPLFTLVTLRSEHLSDEEQREARKARATRVHYPLNIPGDPESDLVLGGGWHDREPVNRWSEAQASLTLPIPEECRKGGCSVELHVVAFAASTARPMPVAIHAGETPDEVASTAAVTIRDDDVHGIIVPLPASSAEITLHMEVPAATSPQALGVNVDNRVLGVSLRDVVLHMPGAAH